MNNDLSLVIGASGLVGRSLMSTLGHSGANVIGTYVNRAAAGLRQLDISDGGQVAACIAELRPRNIYLTAALTHVDYCEEHPEQARRTNVLGPLVIAQEASRLGAKLIFYSSEYVFDGAAGPYSEAAAPNPLSVYGRTKLEAETAVRDVLEDALILRTTVVFGWDRTSKNFAMQIYERLEKGLEMIIPEDQLGTPTWTEYLAETSVRLIQKGVSGVVNVAGRDTVPRSEFARALVKTFGGQPERVIAVSTAHLSQKAPRPLRGGLRTDKLAGLLSEAPISLEESLARLKLQWQSDCGNRAETRPSGSSF
ncbi:MAG TPA: SDR family oxidoreductase [Candidatus Binatia bacterium]|nr:SDR family oxidoreductase [Candidatus Binatia bacterium]